VSELSNKQQVEAIFDAFNRGAVQEILDQVSEDALFVGHLDPIVPWSGEYQGKAQILQYFQRLGGAVEVSGHPIDYVMAQDDTVTAQGSVSFTVRETGKPGSSTWVYVLKLADGKVRSFEQFNDQGLAEAFRG
jgi:ketosteroid isomerase-like protein